MLVQKQSFRADALTLACGQSIPIEVGYETYGTLNEQKDNAILVSHYFSATSHCAGKYRETDAAPGYWDALIGPGKAVDTNRYFVISTDNLCNVQAFSPDVITTGPASINPKTGKRYGLSFPVVSTKDNMEVQKKLIDSLGIKKLRAVMGPSTGGMIALHWAVNYPDMLQKCIGVITNAQHPAFTSFIALQHAMRAGYMDPHFNNGDYYESENEPVEGLRLAAQMMMVGAFSPLFFERTYPRDSLETEPYCSLDVMSSPEKAMYDVIVERTKTADLNSWIYSCKMLINHDIAHGFESMDDALSRMKAPLLMIPNKQDILHPWQFNAATAQRVNELGGKAEVYAIDSDLGHMAGILQADLFANKVKGFLESN